METINCKCNKTTLNKILLLTSSRYNPVKKKEAVKNIIFLVEKGEDIKRIFESGFYSDGAGKRLHDKYTLEIKDGTATLYNFTDETKDFHPETNTAYILEKPKVNKYYLIAKKIYYNNNLYEISEGNYEVIGQDYAHFFIFHENMERHVFKRYCTILEA
jgi:hypothetical protein